LSPRFRSEWTCTSSSGRSAALCACLRRCWLLFGLTQRSWCGISGFAGFYVANTVSLSFGALAVNDIVAAALAVTFVELSSRAFFSAWPNPPLSLWLLHCFKLGFVYGLISDSFKLGA
jgi:hypothetical protein